MGQLTQCSRDSDEKERKVDLTAKSLAATRRHSYTQVSTSFLKKKGVLTRLDQSFTLASVLLWCASPSHHQKCIAKTSSPVLVHFLVPLTEMVVLIVGTKL